MAKKSTKNKIESKGDAPQKKRSRWYYFGQAVLWILTVISIIGLVLACFGGNFNPANAKGISLFILTLPAWIVLWFIVAALNAIWCRKALIFSILTFVACANAIWDYCPLNLFGPSTKKYAKCEKFTLLTYNVASFKDQNNNYPDGLNPTMSYIIRQNADVVCLQETEVPGTGPFKLYHIEASQVDSLNRLYPYRMVYGGFLTVLSKYPVEAIHTPRLTDDPYHKWRQYPIGLFRLNIEGTPVTLFNVHLQSYGLSLDDKKLYKDISDGKEIAEAAESRNVKESLREIRRQIFSKVHDAGVKRAFEAETLCKYIEKFGGPNVIVAGDFNDVPGCYTLRRLDDLSLKQVYPELGFGPMITFNADRFYFRIDHILYRGNLQPLHIRRGSTKSSDHYPLICTFAITPTK